MFLANAGRAIEKVLDRGLRAGLVNEIHKW